MPGAAPDVLVHGTAIALPLEGGGAAAVVVRGPSGSGKSDLALRCIALAPSRLLPEPAALVADDQVAITGGPDLLEAASPPPIRGLIEVRGVGVVPVPVIDRARLVLVVDLCPREEIERLPEPDLVEIAPGARLPRLRIDPRDASAPVKLLLALRRAAG